MSSNNHDTVIVPVLGAATVPPHGCLQSTLAESMYLFSTHCHKYMLYLYLYLYFSKGGAPMQR